MVEAPKCDARDIFFALINLSGAINQVSLKILLVLIAYLCQHLVHFLSLFRGYRDPEATLGTSAFRPGRMHHPSGCSRRCTVGRAGPPPPGSGAAPQTAVPPVRIPQKLAASNPSRTQNSQDHDLV